MKKSVVRLVIGFVFLCLHLVCGCSRETGCETKIKDTNTGRIAEGTFDLDSELKNLQGCFTEGDVSPITRGGDILEMIVNRSDVTNRLDSLGKFRVALLGLEFTGNDYRKLSTQLVAMEELKAVYLEALFRCGGDLGLDVGFRLDFLKWLRRETARESGVESSDDLSRPGIHVTRDRYQSRLKYTFDRHLRELEGIFNDHCSKRMTPEEFEGVRRKIEAFVGRPIRTNAQILHDRMNRPRPASCRSPTEDDVPVSSGL